MTSFCRGFPIGHLSEAVLEKNGWFCDLLRQWHPSGDVIGTHMAQEEEEHLRLAIRCGYLNFYRAGQSVAKVSFNSEGSLQAKIHNKYVYGIHGRGQKYVTLTSEGFPGLGTARLVQYDGATRLRGWISQANKHVGPEKRFVDLVVSRNPDIIDLEMGLPAYSENPKEHRAPRMDLVGLEPIGDHWQIAFWEAKLVNDGRARCRGEDPPKLIKQLKDYTDWLAYKDNRDLVAQAYQRACRLLVELRSIAKRFHSDIEELGLGIRNVAASNAPLPSIDDKPRLLIDDRTMNVAFTENGHLKKLREKYGLHVQMVQKLDQMTLETCTD